MTTAHVLENDKNGPKGIVIIRCSDSTRVETVGPRRATFQVVPTFPQIIFSLISASWESRAFFSVTASHGKLRLHLHREPKTGRDRKLVRAANAEAKWLSSRELLIRWRRWRGWFLLFYQFSFMHCQSLHLYFP